MSPESAGPGLVAACALVALAAAVSGDGAARSRLRGLRPPAESANPGSGVGGRSRLLVVAGVGVAGIVWVLAGGPAGGPTAVLAGVLLGGLLPLGVSTAFRRLGTRAAGRVDAGGLAAGWELLATCLDAGLPVPTAVQVAAERIDGPTAVALRRVAGLLELGSPGEQAWAAAAELPQLVAFGRAARRSADTGTGLARVARGEAARLRDGLADAAEARAERAAVLVAAPLGLCFLPAFLALGIAPVVLGLAGEALSRW
ncbi:type II secretion system F family protein [Pseudonocardia sp. WMMC193]|uniref:type II secretion system F family protein n=1 Tax=Pseudonocardia sp. WMMC193 TaxID=2911965 RepID=UPI001F374A8C|nr:type II secretion system F family protein [Pseudonocardia sp. WMMC193]MCF7551622.1 type II secretion system F family protein [Pseudonocardia sp. WMMC193]